MIEEETSRLNKRIVRNLVLKQMGSILSKIGGRYGLGREVKKFILDSFSGGRRKDQVASWSQL